MLTSFLSLLMKHEKFTCCIRAAQGTLYWKFILKAKIFCCTKNICQCLESDGEQLTTTPNVAFYQSPFIKAAEPWMNSFFRPTVVTGTHEVPGKQRWNRRERLWLPKGKQQGAGDHSYFHSCLGINSKRKEKSVCTDKEHTCPGDSIRSGRQEKWNLQD